jgi:DNA-binding protein H-NS
MSDQANDLKEVEGIDAIDDEIKALQKKKQELIEKKRTTALATALKLVRTFGFTAQELELVAPSKASSSASKTKQKPKYRNPGNSADTWHGGKGPKPKWVKAFLDGGGKIEDCLIK